MICLIFCLSLKLAVPDDLVGLL